MLEQFIFSIFINVLVSSIICISFSVYLLSSGIMGPLGPINNPLSVSFSLGAVVGILHGLITNAVIYWYNPDSIIGNGFSTFIATEILLIAAIVRVIILYVVKNKAWSFSNLGVFIPLAYVGFWWFLLLSAILVIPSFLVGLLTGFLVGLLTGKIHEIIFLSL